MALARHGASHPRSAGDLTLESRLYGRRGKLAPVPHGRPVRVLVGERASDAREDLCTALELAGFEVVARSPAAADAVDAARRERPGVCVLAGGMPGDLAGAVRSIVAALPDTAVVVLSESPSVSELADSLGAGACGYLPRGSSRARLAGAIDAALEGWLTAPAHLVRALPVHFGAPPTRVPLPSGTVARLTSREADVLDFIIAGSPTQEIAAALSISPVTVRRYVSALLSKTGAPNRATLSAMLGGTGRRREPGSKPAPAPAAPVREEVRVEEVLSPRELEVLRLVADGVQNAQIARELVISPSTVRNHVTRIIEKLGAKNRTEAAVIAARQGRL